MFPTLSRDAGRRWRVLLESTFVGGRADRRTGAVVAVVLLGAVALVFWQQILGLAVYIGESDRLNSYLSMRLAEYDALKEYGRVPAWNASMFGGFSMAALHWMNPGKDPIAYVLQLLPRSDVLQALGFISIALVAAACFTAFLYIREVTGANGPALAGGVAYGLSVFSLHRASQVDNAELTVVLIPLGLLALRRVSVANLVRPMIGLTAVVGALAFWAFLQEVAYAFLFFACYALYRAGVLRRQSPEAGWMPLIVLLAGFSVALACAAPRLITIGQEFVTLTRTTTLHYHEYPQILRFFHEGIYGRYFEEGRLLGHSLNLHEGLQLTSSTALALFVCLGIARPRSTVETVAAVGFFALFAAMLPTPDLLHALFRRFVTDPLSLPLTLTLYKILTYGLLLLLAVLAFRRSRPYSRIAGRLERLRPAAPRPADTSFHVCALTTVLFLVLVYEGAELVWRLFLRVDFTHMRLSLLALLPLCTLFAVYLTELKRLPVFDRVPANLGGRRAIGLICLAGALAYLLNGPLLDQFVARDAIRIHLLDRNALVPVVALRVGLTTVLLGAFAALLGSGKPWTLRLRSTAGAMIGAFVIVETMTYGHFKVSGPHTWTYPVPFRGFNYLNVDPPLLRPPDTSARAAFRDAFDTDHYRTVLLSEAQGFPGAKIPHVTAFWGLRTIGGYGTGVTARMAALPWPAGVRTLRMIDFRSLDELDASVFPLLAFLNVRYLLWLTPDIYFNVASSRLPDDPGRRGLTIGGRTYPLNSVDIGGRSFQYLENPVEPLPRHFMVERVVGRTVPPRVILTSSEASNDSGLQMFEGQVDDLTRTSFVEGDLAETGPSTFDAAGDLSISYRGDVIEIQVTPSAQERFVVLTEAYHPQWRVYAGQARAATVPTNLVMNGVLIPPGLDRVTVRFEPFSSQPWAPTLLSVGVIGFALFAIGLRRTEVSRASAS